MSSPSGCARNHPLPNNIIKTKKEKQILEEAINNKRRCWLQKAPRSRRARCTTGHHPGNHGQAETKQRKLWTESKRAVMRGGGRGIKGGRREGEPQRPTFTFAVLLLLPAARVAPICLSRGGRIGTARLMDVSRCCSTGQTFSPPAAFPTEQT